MASGYTPDPAKHGIANATSVYCVIEMLPDIKEATNMYLDERIATEAATLRGLLEESNERLRKRAKKQEMICLSLRGICV